MTQKSIDEKNKFQPKQPDYSANGVAVWKNQSEKGEYLTIKIVGHNTITAFTQSEKDTKQTK